MGNIIIIIYPPLHPKAVWLPDGYKGIVLPISAMSTLSSSGQQYELAYSFFSNAIKASIAILQ
jgi:hypothetical protein